MAEIKSITLEDETTILSIKVSKEEYELVKEDEKNLVILPASKSNEVLTTGKIGNGNRIMLPNKVLKRSSISKLLKHVKARIFGINEKKLLLIELEDNGQGIPKFGGTK